MKLSHWTNERFVFDPLRSYTQKTGPKPKGFWLDVDEDWKRWCDDNDFRLNYLKVRYAVEIAKPERMLWLTDSSLLDQFNGKFAARDQGRIPNDANFYIDWNRVAHDFAGLIIAPYCLERRFDLMWYYGFDCASGCVWDLAAIGSVVQRAE